MFYSGWKPSWEKRWSLYFWHLMDEGAWSRRAFKRKICLRATLWPQENRPKTSAINQAIKRKHKNVKASQNSEYLCVAVETSHWFSTLTTNAVSLVCFVFLSLCPICSVAFHSHKTFPTFPKKKRTTSLGKVTETIKSV